MSALDKTPLPDCGRPLWTTPEIFLIARGDTSPDKRASMLIKSLWHSV